MQLNKTNAVQCKFLSTHLQIKFLSTHLQITHIGNGGNIYTIDEQSLEDTKLKY